MMLKNISFGVYVPGNSLMHRLQARTKILLLVMCVAWVFTADTRRWHFAPFIAITVCAFASLLLAGISPREIWRRVWLLVLLLALGIVPLLLSAANDRTNKVLFALGPLWTSYGLIRQALLAGSAIVLVLFLLSLLPQLKRRRSVRRARTFLVLALLAELLALWLLGDHSDATPFPIGPLPVTDYAIWLLVSIVVVLLVFYTFSLILTMTTSPMALIEGMSMLLSPLRRLRLPVDDFTLMALLALRFVPTLLEEVELLLKAQASRGADMTSGTLRERMQSLVALFVPLIQGTFRRASELATALEARGYEVEGCQTRLYETSLSRTDYIALALVFIIALLSLLI